MTGTQLAIIDSGGANIASLLFAFRRLGIAADLTSNADTIASAERVVLPGVGAAKDSMQRLRDAGLLDLIRSLKQPVLGICLGMQLLCDASEEEDVECLGIIPGVARKLTPAASLPVPNMGWCAVRQRTHHKLLNGISNGSHFYFVHSYALPVSEYTLAEARHQQPFSALLHKDNFLAAQCHPERSSKTGARLLQNFLELPA